MRSLVAVIVVELALAFHAPQALAQNAPIQAQRPTIWREMGDWYVASTNGPRGCYLGRLQNERTVLRLNWEPGEQIYFLSAHDAALNELAEKQMFDFTLGFTPGTTFDRPAIVTTLAGARDKSLLFLESDATVLRQLAASQRVSITLHGKTLVEFDTAEAAPAMAELAKCNQAKLGVSPTTLGLATPPGIGSPNNQPEKWKTLDHWLVAYDTDWRGCYIKGRYHDLRLGHSDAAGGFYILAEDRDWKWVETGGRYDVVLRLNSYPERRVVMQGIPASQRALPGLLLPQKDRTYIDDFAGSNELAIERNGELIARITLRHTGAALREMDECQQAHKAKGGSGPRQ